VPDEQPVVNRLLVQKGRYLSARQHEILANEDFGFFYQLKVGGQVGITGTDGKETFLPVSGLTYNPCGTLPQRQPPYLYLTEMLRELFPDESEWEWSLGLRPANPSG
jgi:hypothetical protein